MQAVGEQATLNVLHHLVATYPSTFPHTSAMALMTVPVGIYCKTLLNVNMKYKKKYI